MKYWKWYVIDEDTNEIVAEFVETEHDAVRKFEELKENRNPMSATYWNTWTLFRRWAA